MAKKSKSSGGGSASASSTKVTDARFANFESDPRFRLPSKRQTKTKIDKRFAGVFKDEEFTKTAKVDRYGRPLSGEKHKKALKNLYEPEDEESGDDSDDSKEDEEGADIEVEDDEVVKRALRAADKKYDPARGGGFESSSDESDSDSDEGDEPEVEEEEAGGASIQRFQDEQADVPLGEVTNRIAIVNIDWDHIKSVDLFAVFSSFVPSGGRIEKVSIFPSEFGKERMAQEEVEGPPRDIFKKNTEKEDEDDEEDEDSEDDEKIKQELLQEGDDQDFDTDALRSYQLDRLRYYYAIMVCSDKHTAETIYREVDGREYLASSNFLDLRFVPDDVTFDDQPRDECTGVPAGYRPVEFVTDALQHSKVKLTWDTHPDEAARKDSIKRAFGGSRNEIADNDLKAYLASDSSDDEEDEPVAQGAGGDEEEAQPKLSKKELARRKMREALGFKDGDEPKSSKSSGPVGGMQITFTPALSGKPEAKEEEEEEVEETTIEKYKRKERERKEMKREKARAKREGRDPEAVVEAEPQETEDLGFDDPFFQTEGGDEPSVTKSSIRKEERRKKREAREAEEKQKMEERANLELIMADDTGDATAAAKASSKMSHFDMNEILKQEKASKKKLKGKAAKKQAAKDAAAGEKNLLQNDFEMDVDDDRFKAVFDDHEFAIDPSNPKFKATTGMKKLLEKGRNKRKGVHDEGQDDANQRSSKKSKASGGELSGLVQSVKRKAKKA
ncbi:hypothetical protein MGG_00053 [Pyricularia oryzae 70-15]|uniref:Uncharacterized protein n=1 Tax=Pyricularia oryzae (strain 70-15 / ATCC MYA-4617 / FGSC 8958) TaxID=242507 RepID=G4NET3_PYRO7|nr:uncharacterized protein MGG_00053 [Pyricularia oryzae 70-15]EHA49506.1 hypothetical protein MGG_00053 [Pyricularia oryzae 70-15]